MQIGMSFISAYAMCAGEAAVADLSFAAKHAALVSMGEMLPARRARGPNEPVDFPSVTSQTSSRQAAHPKTRQRLLLKSSVQAACSTTRSGSDPTCPVVSGSHSMQQLHTLMTSSTTTCTTTLTTSTTSTTVLQT